MLFCLIIQMLFADNLVITVDITDVKCLFRLCKCEINIYKSGIMSCVLTLKVHIIC